MDRHKEMLMDSKKRQESDTLKALRKQGRKARRIEAAGDALAVVFVSSALMTVGGLVWSIWALDVLPLQVTGTAFITAVFSDQVGREFFS